MTESISRDGIVPREARGGGQSHLNAALSDAGRAVQKDVNTDGPLVSIILFVRNGMPHVKRAVASVLAQEHRNFEYIVQDGRSTDGTVEYLKSLKDPRIKIVSEKDNGPADAFAKAVARCNGEILASCLADEELLPDALSKAVELFDQFPHLGAITGDAHVTDIHGNIYAKFTGAPFNLLYYLNGEYCPYWCSTFFSMSALRFVGVFDERWSKASLEFEIWCRLAMETDILYVPEIFSKYAHHADQLSQAGDRVEEELEARIDIIRNKMFGRGKYFGENYGLRDAFTLTQLINLHEHLEVWNPDAAKKAYKRIVDSNLLTEFNMTRAAPVQTSDSWEVAAPPTSAPDAAAPHAGGVELVPSHAAGDLSPSGKRRKPRREHIPLHEFIVPTDNVLGKVYRAAIPARIRLLIPRDLKIKLANIIGARGR